ncbi:hypothetical protein QVD17_36911 [Tagetes erecta]|uniref:Uncharacterized protein n=1 Tax=Tagetes erecta TaxID=13708 RepID=A0AAD8JT55_TARER|nr:hypothetical protein QVD17_36911 [Tagetes erecta]
MCYRHHHDYLPPLIQPFLVGDLLRVIHVRISRFLHVLPASLYTVSLHFSFVFTGKPRERERGSGDFPLLPTGISGFF